MNADVTQQLIDELARQAPTLAGRLSTWQAQGHVMHGALLRAAWEQEPRHENRIELSDERDELGIPRARLVWRQSELDRRTIRESMLLLGSICVITTWDGYRWRTGLPIRRCSCPPRASSPVAIIWAVHG